MLLVPSFNLILNCYFHPVKYASTTMVFPLQTHNDGNPHGFFTQKRVMVPTNMWEILYETMVSFRGCLILQLWPFTSYKWL